MQSISVKTNRYFEGKKTPATGSNQALNLGNICKPETQPFFSPTLIYDNLLGDCANGYVITSCVPFLWVDNLSVWGRGPYLYHIKIAMCLLSQRNFTKC